MGFGHPQNDVRASGGNQQGRPFESVEVFAPSRERFCLVLRSEPFQVIGIGTNRRQQIVVAVVTV